MFSTYSVILLTLVWINIHTAGAQVCRFGDFCPFPCRCRNDASCDAQTGECPNGCAENKPRDPSGQRWPRLWTGPGCQVGNFFLNEELTEAVAAPIDGVITRCFVTGSYWLRRFGSSQFVLLNFTIFLHDRTGKMLWDTYLGVGTTDDLDEHRTCAHIKRGDIDHNLENQVIRKSCDRPLAGSAFSFRTTAPNITLLICEIVFSGYSYEECSTGMWGPGCLRSCNCETSCDDITGICPTKCQPGWTGETCQTECPDFRWGSGCNEKCNCANQAEVCGKKDGSCITGCSAGLSGRGCKKYTDTIVSPPEKEGFKLLPLIIMAAIIALLFIIVIAVLIGLCMRMRHLSHQQNNVAHNSTVNNGHVNTASPPMNPPMSPPYPGNPSNPVYLHMGKPSV